MSAVAERAPRRPASLPGLGRGLIRCVVGLVLLWPIGVLVSAVIADRSHLLFDFRGGLYDAGRAILAGRDPYRSAFLAHQAAIMRHGGVAIGEGTRRVFSVPLYPASANLAVVPFAALPFWAAGVIDTVLSVAAMMGALWLLGVRDRRPYAVVAVSWPFLFGLLLGAIGPLLALGAAATWRWRDRLIAPGLSVAALVAAKLFPWTLAVWLLISGRRRAAVVAIAATGALTLGAWAAIGLHGLAGYPRMLADATFIQEGRADSVATVALALGAAPRIAQAVALLGGLGLLGLAARIVREPAGEGRAFGLAIVACLIATPLVWDHYMVLLFVPIALLSPRYSRLWLLPLIASSAETIGDAVLPAPGSPVTHPSQAVLAAVLWLLVMARLIARLAAQPAGPGAARGPRKCSTSSAETRSGSSAATQWEASGMRTIRSRFGTSRGSGSASSAPR
jgi:alpha-1,2-mannosyltransferase